MEAGYKNFWVRFKSVILASIFLGIATLLLVYIFDPDRSDQIFDILTILGVLLVMIPLFLFIYQNLLEDRKRSQKKGFSKG